MKRKIVRGRALLCRWRCRRFREAPALLLSSDVAAEASSAPASERERGRGATLLNQSTAIERLFLLSSAIRVRFVAPKGSASTARTTPTAYLQQCCPLSKTASRRRERERAWRPFWSDLRPPFVRRVPQPRRRDATCVVPTLPPPPRSLRPSQSPPTRGGKDGTSASSR